MNNREELTDKIADLFGLELSPDLEPYHLLTRAESGALLEAVDYTDEVNAIADFITEQTRLARIDELNYWTHRGSGQIEMSAEQVTNRITQLVPKPEKDNNR